MSDTDFDGANGAIEFFVGDVITGLATFRQNLYIFCKKSIYRLEGYTSADFVLTEITRGIGCLGHDTIQEVGGDVVYLSQTGIRTLSGTERTDDLELGIVSKGIQLQLREYLNLNEDAYSSCVIPTKNQYRLFIYQSALAASSTISFCGTLTDTPIDPKGIFEWSTIVGIKASAADSSLTNDNDLSVFVTGSNDYVYRMESGNSFDGSSIPAIYRTPFITLGNATLRKVLQKIQVYTRIEGDLDITLNALLDNENTGVIQPSSIQLEQSGGVSVYGTAVYDTSVYAAVLFPIFKKNLVGSGFTVAFQFASTGTNPPHKIDSIDVTYGQKGRR